MDFKNIRKIYQITVIIILNIIIIVIVIHQNVQITFNLMIINIKDYYCLNYWKEIIKNYD